MAGLLDALGSYSGDDTTKDQFGQTQADRRQPLWSGLIKAGLLGVAAGGNLMPADRAKYIAEAGGAIGDIQPQMQAQQTNAMQNLLRQQQVKLSGVEMQGKQADLAQQAQWRAYAASPEFQKAMDSANATPAERMAAQAAAMKGDFASVSKVLDPKRNQWQYKDGMFISPDGRSAYDPVWKTTINLPGGPGGPGAPGGPGPTPTPTPTTPTVPTAPAVTPDQINSPDINVRTRASDAEINQWSNPQAQPTPTPPKPTDPSQIPVQDATPLPPGVTPANWNQAVFDKLPDAMKPMVKAIASYQLAMPGATRGATLGLKPFQVQQLDQAVQAVTNGSYDVKNFPVISQAMKDYAPGGKIGQQLLSLNYFHGHAAELYDAFKNLDPTNTQWVNQARNLAMSKTGNPNATVVDLLTSVVGGEAMKAITNHVTDAEKADWAKPLSSFNSKAQAQAVIDSMFRLVGVRDRELTNAWNGVTKGTMPTKTFLSPENQASRDFILSHPLDAKAATTPTQAEIAAEIARRRQQQQGQ